MKLFYKIILFIFAFYISFSLFFNHIEYEQNQYYANNNPTVKIGVDINNKFGLSRLLFNQNNSNNYQMKMEQVIDSFNSYKLKSTYQINRLNSKTEELEKQNSKIIRSLRYY